MPSRMVQIARDAVDKIEYRLPPALLTRRLLFHGARVRANVEKVGIGIRPDPACLGQNIRERALRDGRGSK